MLLPDMIPYGTSESKEILDAVAAYGADISLVDGVRHEQRVIGLWSKGSGYQNIGAEAVELVRQLRSDILLLDLAMSKHSGLDGATA